MLENKILSQYACVNPCELNNLRQIGGVEMVEEGECWSHPIEFRLLALSESCRSIQAMKSESLVRWWRLL